VSASFLGLNPRLPVLAMASPSIRSTKRRPSFRSSKTSSGIGDLQIAGPFRKLACGLLLILGLLLGTLPAQEPAPLPDDEITVDTTFLARAPHRLGTTAQYTAAADYVQDQLRRVGVDRVIAQEFPSMQTRTVRCEVTLPDSRVIPLTPLRPNRVFAPVTPEEGLEGEFVYAGRGSIGEFGALAVRGKIVLLDYLSGSGWLRAFRLGARAVIICRGSDTPLAGQSFYSSAAANIPRYYFDGNPEELLAAKSGTIRASIVWQPATGRNIVAHIRGRDPEFFLRQPEVIVLAAPLDSFGEVPERSPGARGAANAAGLLHIARELVRNRPRRHTILLFLDQEARGHQGSAAFYRALAADVRNVRPQDRRRSLENEARFVALMRQALSDPAPLMAQSPVQKELQRRVRAKADSATAEIAYGQTQRRLRARVLESGRGEGNTIAGQDELARLRRELADLQTRKETWNGLQRALGQERAPEGGSARRLGEALEQIRQEVATQARELEIKQRNLAADEQIAALMGNWFISFHASLALGDSTARWGIVQGGESLLHSERDTAGLYGRILAGLMAGYGKLEAAGRAPAGLDVATIDGSMADSRAYWAAPGLTHSGEVAGAEGIFNLVFATAQEGLLREGTPADRWQNLDMDNLRAQVREIAAFLQALGSEEELSQLSSITSFRKYEYPRMDESFRTVGPVVLGKTRGKAMADERMAGAVIFVEGAPPGTVGIPFSFARKRLFAFDDFILTQTDSQGNFGYGPVPGTSDRQYRVFAATFDAWGNVAFATDRAAFDGAGERITIVPVLHGFAVQPPQFRPGPGRLFEARGNARLDSSRHFLDSRDGLVTWFTEDRIERVKLFSEDAAVALNIPAAATNAEVLGALGEGLPAANALDRQSAAPRAGQDLTRVTGARLDLLRSRGIANASMDELHGTVEDLYAQAGDAPGAGLAEGLAASAFLRDRLVYTRALAAIKDLVSAVLVLLLLAVPFSFALERLIIGSTSVYRQILWFGGFFTASFLALYFTHPAFAISATPLVIFLGFSVLVLSVLVIWIIMRKFEDELKEIQGLGSKVHIADVSRLSTILAAMSMGISTMRRRPLRTSLTAATIVLLTFTILCFASFDQQIGVVRTFSQPAVNYSGVFFHRVNWRSLDAQFLDILESRWGRESTVARRFWLTPERANPSAPAANSAGYLVSDAAGRRQAVMRGMLGLEPAELRQRPELRRLLGEPAEADFPRTVWMTQAAATRLGAQPGDTVRVGGRELKVGALLDARRVIGALDMDGSAILPVDLGAQGQTGVREQTGLSDGAEPAGGQASWTYLPVDSVLIGPVELCRDLGGTLRAVTVYTSEAGQAGRIADELAGMTQAPVSAAGRDGVYTHTVGSVLKASGAKDLVFPLILGGLVIFGTMLGSVADREREIYTFSALGLAPAHVASLFFAEALVFSVLGGMGGYLLAQFFLRALEFLAGFGLVTVPEMNYSSSNAIFTILIVMAVVLLSAVYPALKASRSANPGVMRGWKLPPADGDTLDILFPFTVSEYDFTGVVSFLKEHFDNYQDASLGVFMTQGTQLNITAPAQYGPFEDGRSGLKLELDSRIALAPFDLGVTQQLHMTSAPSEVDGIDEVRILLRRVSGEPKDWRRLNKNLLDNLRRQFLIWRALPRETIELYRGRTLERAGSRRK
jgi:hypothetical protein